MRRKPAPSPRGLRRSALFALVVLAAGCTPAPEFDLVVRDVAVLDLASEAWIPGQTVVVHGGKILQLGASVDIHAQGDEEIDGSGRFLMPGLIDAHVHVDHPDELNLYPAYGVTGLLVLRGLPQHLSWRSEVSTGSRFGPRIFTTGDYMDGYPPFMQPMMSFDDIEASRQSVRQQKEAGYDFVKVYTRLSDELRTAIIEETHAGGRCVIGHAGPNTTLEDLVARGQDNIAHGQDLLRWYFDGPDDPDGISRVVDALRGSKTAVTPNLSWTAGLIAQGTDLDALLAKPVARALHPAILQPFRKGNNRYLRNADEWVPEVEARFEVEKALTRAMHEAGVQLLAGTDASTSGVLPGDAMHEELKHLVAAGLSPAEAIETATSSAGDFLKRCVDPDLRVGKVEVGYAADLVLLDANPLENIENSRAIAGTVLDGHWFDSSKLGERLDALDTAYTELRQQVIDLEKALFGGDTKEARRLFDEARSEHPGETLFSQYTPFFVGYGYLYGQEGFSSDPARLKSALDLYTMYLETYPQFHSAHYQLGLAQLANGMTAEARASFERALEIHPSYPDARKQLAELNSN